MDLFSEIICNDMLGYLRDYYEYVNYLNN